MGFVTFGTNTVGMQKCWGIPERKKKKQKLFFDREIKLDRGVKKNNDSKMNPEF